MKKKFVIFFALAATLFSVGIVGVSAATSSGNTNELKSAGLPCDVLFSTPSGNFANISSANVWIANNGIHAQTNVTTQDGWNPYLVFSQEDAQDNSADVFIYRVGNAVLRRVTSTLPFNPWNITADDLAKLQFNIGLGIAGPVTATYTQHITRTYNIRVPYQNSQGQFVWGTISQTFNDTYSVNAVANQVSYLSIPLFENQQLDEILRRMENDGYEVDQAIVASIDVYTSDIPSGRLSSVYLNNPRADDDLYANIRRIAANSLGDLYEVAISYDNLDWTKWLTNAVGGFMGFEIVPGLPIYGILSALLGIPLLIWFLRLFAGG